MKPILFILICIVLFMGYFFLLSTIGMLWYSYSEVIHSEGWFFSYALMIGWWLVFLSVVDIFEEWFD